MSTIKADKNKGMVHTGWSRYDHLLPIYEIMPAAYQNFSQLW
jgi:hypothetical protein